MSSTGIALHHTPLLPRKRELPAKPMSLDLRHSNRDLLRGRGGRNSRSMNFPRVERSPSRDSNNSLVGLETDIAAAAAAGVVTQQPLRNGIFNGVGETPNAPVPPPAPGGVVPPPVRMANGHVGPGGYVSTETELLNQTVENAVPLPSMPHGLRTALYRNRRTLLE